MTTLQDAAQQLIDFHDGPAEAKRHDVFIRHIESIRTALAQQGEQPVAWLTDSEWGGDLSFYKPDFGKAEFKNPPKITPLYAGAAPAPQAQPLRELSA